MSILGEQSEKEVDDLFDEVFNVNHPTGVLMNAKLNQLTTKFGMLLGYQEEEKDGNDYR